MCRVTDLRQKEVVNVTNGVRLGYVDDVEFETATGHIVAIIVYGRARLFGLFGRSEECVIPWCDIEKIGSDIVLVCCDAQPVARANIKNGFFASLFK